VVNNKDDSDTKNQKKTLKQIKSSVLKSIAFLWTSVASNAFAATYRSVISWVQSSVFPAIRAYTSSAGLNSAVVGNQIAIAVIKAATNALNASGSMAKSGLASALSTMTTTVGYAVIGSMIAAAGIKNTASLSRLMEDLDDQRADLIKDVVKEVSEKMISGELAKMVRNGDDLLTLLTDMVLAKYETAGVRLALVNSDALSSAINNIGFKGNAFADKLNAYMARQNDRDNLEFMQQYTQQNNLREVNRPPHISDEKTPTNIAIDETNIVGTKVGHFQVTDADKQDEITWAISDSRFRVDSNGDILTTAVLDYEDVQNIHFVVGMTDKGGLGDFRVFNLKINNMWDEMPTTPQLTNLTMPIGTPAGTVVAAISATDRDIGDQLTFFVSNDLYRVENNVLILNRMVTETDTSDVAITVVDRGGNSVSAIFHPTLVSADSHLINGILLEGDGITENASLTHMHLSAITLGTSLPITWSVNNPDFVVNASGQLDYIRSLDYESGIHSISVQVTASNGETTKTADFSINVHNVNEAPSLVLYDGGKLAGKSLNSIFITEDAQVRLELFKFDPENDYVNVTTTVRGYAYAFSAPHNEYVAYRHELDQFFTNGDVLEVAGFNYDISRDVYVDVTATDIHGLSTVQTIHINVLNI
jgi:hypothetical protein